MRNDFRCWQILLKSRKSKNSKNLANVDFWTSSPLGCCVAPIRKSVVVFLRNDVVSHIVAHETHQRLWKISFATPKRLFQQYRHLADVSSHVCCWGINGLGWDAG